MQEEFEERTQLEGVSIRLECMQDCASTLDESDTPLIASVSMPLSWNEVRRRAADFAREFRDDVDEDREAKTFWDAFFGVFDLRRRRLAAFEKHVKVLKNRSGYIDLFWPGVLLVEHKSRGKSLDAAHTQAVGYFAGLSEDELPRYVLVSDFAKFRLYDLDERTQQDFLLAELPERIRLFSFMLGRTTRQVQDETPVNAAAAKLMAGLRDALAQSGYTGEKLELYLVRLLFCFFADDTGIFTPKDHLRAYLEDRTSKDGSDLAQHLEHIFQTLDKDSDKRSKLLDEDLAALPYVNGRLFHERLDMPDFDSKSRAVLLKCCAFNWGAVSPAIFGSMFQGVMDRMAPTKRRDLGAHYTSEENILKALRPLFLDEFEAALGDARGNTVKLKALAKRIRSVSVLDPACGCGNFLIVAYRELRKIELEISRELKRKQGGQREIDVSWLSGIEVDSMYGMEIEDFPARIAETAMWLVDHQVNLLFEKEFGSYRPDLPLNKSARIRKGNALDIDWATFAPRDKIQYVVGNPPFVGKKRRSAAQTADMDRACVDLENHSELDYVACWYVKAAEYVRGTSIRVSFVSTNSIVQGEQVALLWPYLFEQGITINFAHQTFRWDNDASGMAQVYTVIVGFSLREQRPRRLFTYTDPQATAVEEKASFINAYLVDGPNVVVTKRRAPLQPETPLITFGSMPNDGGNLLLDDVERAALLKIEPDARAFVKPLLSADEFINGETRWCLWLVDAQPSDVRSLKAVKERVEAVRKYRQASTRAATRKLADTPALFGEIRQPTTAYILIPRHSSERRDYIPIGLFTPSRIASDSCVVVHSDDLFVFGVLTSAMHMAWVRHVCGRIKSDFRYSNGVVYNTFPWPDAMPNHQQAVRDAAQAMLDVRKTHTGESLADLYDHSAMPKDLRDAHRALDRAVDRCYRPAAYSGEAARFSYLLDLYVDAVTQP